jgi:hypothetical protein
LRAIATTFEADGDNGAGGHWTSHPCPATGEISGACPGYVIDHIIPLKRGGADELANMQWQTLQEHGVAEEAVTGTVHVFFLRELTSKGQGLPRAGPYTVAA